MIDRQERPTAAGALTPFAELAEAHQRLKALYEINKLFVSFTDANETVDRALVIAARTLPLHSAILIQAEDDRSDMIAWSAEGRGERMTAARDNAAAAFSWLVGGAITAIDVSLHPGTSTLPRLTNEAPTGGSLIVIPLVVPGAQPFGLLQVEGGPSLNKIDLLFVCALANQLAVALERDRARRADIVARERADALRAVAEQERVTALALKGTAEASTARYQALAEENAAFFERAQQALEDTRRAVQVREQILAVVSHDLRNPLGTILLTAEVLSETTPSRRAREIPAALQRIQRAADGMKRLIEDLLDFASIENGRLAIARQLEDAGSVVIETVASFEAAAGRKHQRLTAEVEAGLPLAFCDRERILQVLANLVSNAIKATPDGGAITLRLAAQGSALQLTVSDTGPGISAAHLGHLFERYWRGSDTKYKGSGLGLAIARGIVKAHEGELWAESVLGHGASFFFTLPMPAAAQV
ncbi:MAG: ATP-binding protein [Deltaproteobacteria bacterium]|nr:ATP-binding protein [Deltaproteobacteria bacterium]